MDIALKQRLLGASVLIAFAVVVLPMLLRGRQDSDSPGAARIEIEDKPEAIQFETRRFPIGDAPEVEPATESEPPPLELPAPPRPASIETQAAQDDASTPTTADEVVVPPPVAEDAAPANVENGEQPGLADAAPEPEPVPPATTDPRPSSPAAEAPPAAADGRYVVQVASFGSVGNASKLSARLEGLGYRVLTDTVESDVGTLNRVQSVCNGNHGFAISQLGYGLLHERFSFGIQVRCRFVENDNRRIFEKGARNGQSLRLPAAQSRTAFTNDGVVSLG